ncbi:MAG: hypothetical protein FJX57_05225, partial [Alphaproteobacteria bacterium]|nr:hypothetical protein [Alphaproteobacteria bacterium]
YKTFDLLPSEPSSPEPIIRAPAPPRALARLIPRAAADQPWRDDTRGVSILFPPDGATIELDRIGDDLVPLALKAEGGRGRLTWIVDGRPLGTQLTSYVPDGEGFLRLVVIDEQGDSAHATVRVVTPR